MTTEAKVDEEVDAMARCYRELRMLADWPAQRRILDWLSSRLAEDHRSEKMKEGVVRG